MTDDELQFLVLELRHEIARAVHAFEQNTGRRVLEVTLLRVPGRADALVRVTTAEVAG
jgi:hypothetical protein